MWPVAPKTTHTFWVGGLDSEGGSVDCGRRRRGVATLEGDVGVAAAMESGRRCDLHMSGRSELSVSLWGRDGWSIK